MAKAMDLLGERWTLLLVRELLLGTRRYSDLLESLPGLTTNLLAARLKAMQRDGLIESTAEGYVLTELGSDLEPIIMELGRFGARFLGKPTAKDRLDVSWPLLAMKRRYIGGLDVSIALEIAGTCFTLKFEPNWLRVLKQRPIRSAASIHMTADQFRALFLAGASLEASGAEVDGDARVVKKMLETILPMEFAGRAPDARIKTRWSRPTG